MNMQSDGGLKRRFAKTIKEARLGVRDAQYDVGLMYANGLGVEKNLQHAVYWIQKAAEKGLSNAQYLLGTRYASGVGVGEDQFAALVWLQKAAAQGHPKAYLRLGILLRDQSGAISRSHFEQAIALGVLEAGFYLGSAAEAEGDWATAETQYVKAAQAGSARANHALGQLHFEGRIDTAEFRKAIEYFRKAAKVNYPPSLVALHDSDKVGRGRKSVSGADAGRANPGERRRTLVDWSSTFEPDDDLARYSLGRMFEEGIKVPKRMEDAMGWYRAAANMGNASATWALAQLSKQDVVTSDWDHWCGKAAEAGVSQAQWALGEHLLSVPGNGRTRLEAIRLLSSAAGAQHAIAAKALARTYLDQRDQCAYAAYLLAAQSGDPEAQCWVGLAHKDGLFGVNADAALAAHWLEASAHGGHVAAQSHFAGILLTGVGAPRNLAEAFKWYLLAAEGGHPVAQWNVSNFFVRGIGGVEKDLKQAYLWCSRAAQQGFPPAQASQGVFLLKMRKPAEAMEWLYRAAQNGDGEAQFNLYVQLEKLPEKAEAYGGALKWCLAAAESGIVAAQSSLAARYANGVSLPVDVIEAHKWLLIAARSGNPACMDSLSRSVAAISSPQLAEAERRAQMWISDHGHRK